MPPRKRPDGLIEVQKQSKQTSKVRLNRCCCHYAHLIRLETWHRESEACTTRNRGSIR
jgi:hypothetical protein